MTTIANFIEARVKTQGAIPFVEFMHLALYAPGLGYYHSSLQKIGHSGADFVTAPELTPLFGQTLANQCAPILASVMNPVIMEFGAGSGQLCVDLLQQLERQHCLPYQYHILEISGDLIARQKMLIQARIPHLADRIHWLTEWPKEPIRGVMIANEVLDAMPVHRFLKTDHGLFESYITLNEHQQFSERFDPCVDTRLKNHLAQALPEYSSPYLSEANLFIQDWVQHCYTALAQGALLIMDYGFPRHEYYHPDRHQGTLMCHHQQKTHANPLIHLGEQDITAHVDFTHVAEAAVDAGFHVAGYTNQASFLISNGLLDLLMAIPIDTDRIQAQQAVKRLIQPHEMGELFKVIALTRNWDARLRGFELQDKRVNL